MKNEVAEECGCYKLLNLIVCMQQLCSVYLINNYPIKGSPKGLVNFTDFATIIFSLIGVFGAIGASNYDDFYIVLYALLLIVYSSGLVCLCHFSSNINIYVCDFHKIIFIASVLFASLSFTTLTSRHTFGEWIHSENVWQFYDSFGSKSNSD